MHLNASVASFLAVFGCAIYAIRLADRVKQAIDWRGGWRWVSVAMVYAGTH